jgi:hypothetical protein
LSRAFNVLIFKLNHYVVHGTNLTWFQSYLAERRKRVDIASSNNKVTASSSRKEIEYRAPLG